LSYIVTEMTNDTNDYWESTKGGILHLLQQV